MIWLAVLPGKWERVEDAELQRSLETIGVLEWFLKESEGMRPGEIRQIGGVYWQQIPNARELH